MGMKKKMDRLIFLGAGGERGVDFFWFFYMNMKSRLISFILEESSQKHVW